jgi:hypothetical protein
MPSSSWWTPEIGLHLHLRAHITYDQGKKASDELEGKDTEKQGKTWCVFETKLSIAAKSQCIPGRPLVVPIYRWPSLEDPVGFYTDSSYMAIYISLSIFKYSNFYLGPFYGALPEHTSVTPILRASIVIPLSVAPEILSES